MNLQSLYWEQGLVAHAAPGGGDAVSERHDWVLFGPGGAIEHVTLGPVAPGIEPWLRYDAGWVAEQDAGLLGRLLAARRSRKDRAGDPLAGWLLASGEWRNGSARWRHAITAPAPFASQPDVLRALLRWARVNVNDRLVVIGFGGATATQMPDGSIDVRYGTAKTSLDAGWLPTICALADCTERVTNMTARRRRVRRRFRQARRKRAAMLKFLDRTLTAIMGCELPHGDGVRALARHLHGADRTGKRVAELSIPEDLRDDQLHALVLEQLERWLCRVRDPRPRAVEWPTLKRLGKPWLRIHSMSAYTIVTQAGVLTLDIDQGDRMALANLIVRTPDGLRPVFLALTAAEAFAIGAELIVAEQLPPQHVRRERSVDSLLQLAGDAGYDVVRAFSLRWRRWRRPLLRPSNHRVRSRFLAGQRRAAAIVTGRRGRRARRTLTQRH